IHFLHLLSSYIFHTLYLSQLFFFFLFFFFFNDPATTEIYTLSLHDALPICLDLALLQLVAAVGVQDLVHAAAGQPFVFAQKLVRSEEHTSELQSRGHLVCRLLLEKKKKKKNKDMQKRKIK